MRTYGERHADVQSSFVSQRSHDRSRHRRRGRARVLVDAGRQRDDQSLRLGSGRGRAPREVPGLLHGAAASALIGLLLAFVIATRASAVDLPAEFNIGGQLDDTATSSPIEDALAFWRITPFRAGHVNLRTQAGVEAGTASSPLRFDPTGTTPQPVKITDGTNTMAVKAASTVPLVTDPAAVVVLSPNGGHATAANQSTEITALQLIDNPVGSASGGTAGTSSYLVGGKYVSTAPSLVNGDQVAFRVDGLGRLINSVDVGISTLAAFSSKALNAINPGATVYTSYTAVGSTAVNRFYAGGSGIGKQTLYLSTPATTSFVTGGDFEAAGDCGTTWIWASGGTGSVAQSAVQANTGTKSCALTFSNSSGGNAQNVQQTISLNATAYRYLNAAFYNVVSAGGAYTRTISIILTDTSANTRTYSLSGLSTSGVFSVSGWIPLQADIENPTSSVGTFDPTAVASVKLNLNDSANKAGTVFWDTVRFSNSLTTLFPIYHSANSSSSITLNPVTVLANGDQIIVGQQNNDTVRKEFFSLVGGVSL